MDGITPTQTPTPSLAPPSPRLRAVEPETATGDAHFQLIPSPTAPTAIPAPAPPRVAPRRAHLPPRLVVVPLVLLVLGAVGWWVVTSEWTPPWVQPPGPLVASGTLEADEVQVGAEVSARIVELVFEHLHKSIRKEKRFTYPGFGTFIVKKRKARKGRNPRTGEVVEIAPTKTVAFKPAPNFKASL